MVKLQPKPEYNLTNTAFYFNNMADCKIFMDVFVDHWCNVPWANPVESDYFYGLNSAEKDRMNIDPKQRAEINLSWGFSLTRFFNIGETEAQKRMLSDILKELNCE